MKPIYLDYAATTPVDPRVLKAMIPYMTKDFGNTMSLHSFGAKASHTLEASRATIAKVIHALPSEIIFTGSATESNNLALKGLAFAHKKKKHIIISAIEHDCVLGSAKWLEKEGWRITILPVDAKGFVDMKALAASITPVTLLVSIIHGNNEIGTLQNLGAIGALSRKMGVFFHTDASQSFAKEPIDVGALKIDLLTGSSQKIYGPKGAAFLYVRNGIRLEPLLHGGGHEGGLRSSTSNLPAIVGFAKAVEMYEQQGKAEGDRIRALRDGMIKDIMASIPGVTLNGDEASRLANNINITIAGIEGESMVLELSYRGVAVSTGSACSSHTLAPSHVLLAIGLSHQAAHGSLRISLGRFTTKEELKRTVAILKSVVAKLRRMSPVPYESSQA